MNVVVIEDELPAANRLCKMIQALEAAPVICARLDSIEAAVQYFERKPMVDLVFMDIQLADGLSFDIFTKTTVPAPVIFTTAFDQYTLKAFKVNSIDYLLKPIDENELKQAVEKYQQLHAKGTDSIPATVLQMMQALANNNANNYKERLLIKRGQQLSYLKTSELAYCFADGKLCYAVDLSGTKFLLESNLSELEEQLQPKQFYRINRSLLVHIDAVKKVHTWLGGRLKVELSVACTAELVVSRDRVNGFKEWLGQ